MNYDKNKENTANTPASQEDGEKTPQNTAKTKKEKTKKQKDPGKQGGFRRFMKSRKAKHGAIATAIVCVVTAITIVLNIVCSLLVDRFPALSFDLTANQVFGLQEDTADYIAHLDKDVTVYVLATKDNFTANGSYFVQAEKLLSEMEASSKHIKVEYVDLNSNPTFKTSYDKIDWTLSNHVFLVECGEDYRVLDLEDCFDYDEETYYYYGSYEITASNVEQEVVTGILNVTTEDKALIDFVTVGSEVDFSHIVDLLETNAYEVNEVSLTTSDLDENANVAILYAPSVDLDEDAVSKLESWLDNSGENGKSLIYVANYNVESTPNLDIFLEKWGIKTSNGVIFETDTNFLVSNTPFVSLTNYNSIFTDGLKNSSIPCVSSYAKGFEITDSELAVPVLTTSTSAGIMPYSEAENENWDYQTAITGDALNVAVKATQKNTEEVASNVVAFGSYEMFSEAVMSYNSYNNSAFFMNTVNTLADRDNIGITIEGKSMDSATLGINVASQNILMVLFVIIVPLGVLVAGLVIWIRRRNR